MNQNLETIIQIQVKVKIKFWESSESFERVLSSPFEVSSKNSSNLFQGSSKYEDEDNLFMSLLYHHDILHIMNHNSWIHNSDSRES